MVVAIAGATWLIAVTKPLASSSTRPAPGCAQAAGLSRVGLDASPTEDWTVGILTAYRRARDEPDPLTVEVVGEDRIALPFPELPTFEVRLRNVDHEGRTFRILCGPYGPSRSSFRARPLDDPEWTFTQLAWFTSSPIREHVSLHAGEVLLAEDQRSERVAIPLAHHAFRDQARPGRVRFYLEYGHDEAFFAHAPHPGCDALAVSSPLEFEWTPVNIPDDPRVSATVRRLIDRMRASPSESMRAPLASRWKSLGPAALPELYEFLDTVGDEPGRRSAVLAALHAATGLLDPAAIRDEDTLVERWRALRHLVITEQ